MNPYIYDPYYYGYNYVQGPVEVGVQPYTNRYIYLNQNSTLFNPTATQSVEPLKTATKVLVNPNFKHTSVHVNPNFNKPIQKPSVIHVNPNVIKCDFNIQNSSAYLPSSSSRDISQIPLPQQPLVDDSTKKQPIIATRTKLVRVQTVSKYNDHYAKQQNSFKSTYKLVNKTENSTVSANSVKSDDRPRLESRKRKVSFHSKYKIVRKSLGKDDGINTKLSLYKLDRRSTRKSLKPRMVSQSTSLISRKIIRNGEVCCKLISVRQLSYKSPVLKKVTNRKSGNTSLKNILIEGQKYKMARNKLSLKRLSEQGLATKFKKINKKTKSPLNKSVVARKKLNSSLSKLKKTNISPNKLKKSNMACSTFVRFGKCRGKDSGKCIKKHNPNQIILCPRFLQGACINSNCLLSHKIQPEKMPTCKFFLEGMCHKNDCQYLHVKINPNADICKDFLEGYCEKASKCTNRHQYLCPDFEKGKFCPRVRCPYPHGSRVRNICLSAVAKKFKVQPKKQEKPLETDVVRYYNDVEVTDGCPNFKSSEQNQVDLKREEAPTEGRDKRPKLGALPLFIPFSESR